MEGVRALFWHHVKLAFIGLFAVIRACGSYCECGGTNATRGESQRITVTFTDDGNSVYTVLSTGAVEVELLVNALFDCSLTQRLLHGTVRFNLDMSTGISTGSSLPVQCKAHAAWISYDGSQASSDGGDW